MPKKKKKIPKQILYKLYFRKKLPLQDIGKIMGCCRETVVARMKEYGLQRRKRGVWQTKYKKQDFSGDEIEKSYLLGFRIGDLSVRLPYKNSKIVIIRCHTTQQDQIRVMEELFQDYGQLVISKSKSASKKPSFFVNCNLNRSFSFLLLSKPYKMPRWVIEDFDNSVAFIAGYVDAEGNFILNQQKARFKLDSYDFFILDWIHQWLERGGIKSKLRLIAQQGSTGYNDRTTPLPNDLWRLNINEAYSLLRFCSLILQFSKHKKRIRNILVCISNIIQRKEDETI